MANNEKDSAEPQSYGSEKDWLTGKTGQTVDNTPEKTSRTDEEFYRSRHHSGSPYESPEAPPIPADESEGRNVSSGKGETDIPRKPA